MPDDLGQRSGAAAKDEEIAAERIASQSLLDEQREPLHALAHIRMTHRYPHPRAGRDHRSAFKAAAVSTGDAEAAMLTRAPPGSSIRIATPGTDRSEEHTSELQSLMRISYAG